MNPSDWISVKDRLPSEGQEVLAVDVGAPRCPFFFCGTYINSQFMLYDDEDWTAEMATHWQPLCLPADPFIDDCTLVERALDYDCLVLSENGSVWIRCDFNEGEDDYKNKKGSEICSGITEQLLAIGFEFNPQVEHDCVSGFAKRKIP